MKLALAEIRVSDDEVFALEEASMTSKLVYLPQILMLQFERWKSLYFFFLFVVPDNFSSETLTKKGVVYSKNGAHGQFDLSFPINGVWYDLISVVLHKGASANTGHFITVSKIGEKWFTFNDDTVTEVMDCDLLAKKVTCYKTIAQKKKKVRVEVDDIMRFGMRNSLFCAYLLFYTKREVTSSSSSSTSSSCTSSSLEKDCDKNDSTSPI